MKLFSILIYFSLFIIAFGLQIDFINRRLLDNNTIQNNDMFSSVSFCTYFNLKKLDEYNMVIISYVLFILYLISSLIIFKYNICLKFFNSKMEIFNYIPNGYIITLSLYLIWWISMLIYSFLAITKGEIMIRLGNWITLNLASILFPILRNSILVILFNISRGRISSIHIILSILCIISVIIKFITVIIFYEPLFIIKIINPSTGGSPLMGTIATALFIVCGIFAMPVIKKKKFELFYYSHRILSLSIILFSSLHYMSFLYYILPAILMYFIDLCIRLYSTNSSIYSKLQNIGLEKYGTSSTFISITFLNKIKTFPGCYYFICFYKDISRFQWHPLSMVSYDNDTIVFCCKNVGKHSWTGRLFDIVDNRFDILENKNIYIQGPYGHTTIDYKKDTYETIIIVAGGIGITPMISILQDINTLYNNKKLLKLKNICFHWIISHISLYHGFKKYFKNLNKDTFKVKIYTTKNFTYDDFETDYSYEGISFVHNKPNITYIFSKIFSKNSKNTVILTCGPTKLTDEISIIANRFNIDISIEVF